MIDIEVIKKSIPVVKKNKRAIVDNTFAILQKLQDMQKSKLYKYNLDDFTIDENHNISYKGWKTKIQGGKNVIETIEIINKYIEECEKPYGKRDLSFVHLV